MSDCESCIHYPPSAADGKPCCFCDPIDPLLNCYQRKENPVNELTYMDCWHYVAPLIPVGSDETSQKVYVMVFNALKEAEKRRKAGDSDA